MGITSFREACPTPGTLHSRASHGKATSRATIYVSPSIDPMPTNQPTP